MCNQSTPDTQIAERAERLLQWQAVAQHSMERADVIAALKLALKRRSDRAWSVTGGRGTAWGWITIMCPPKRGTWMGDSDLAELRRLFGDDHENSIHPQGISIPASYDYRRTFLCRAMFGHAGPFTAEPYWD